MPSLIPWSAFFTSASVAAAFWLRWRPIGSGRVRRKRRFVIDEQLGDTGNYDTVHITYKHINFEMRRLCGQ